MNVRAIVHEAEEGGYWAEVPALPGCVTEGETMDELQANLREAIEGWLEVANERQQLPENANFLELAIWKPSAGSTSSGCLKGEGGQ